ncbi:MAG: hypothetical protein JRF33_10635 [Deltaproteobacteria bacterium]|nr:hypothetical protein [Deltaproteobacteria bacterium]
MSAEAKAPGMSIFFVMLGLTLVGSGALVAFDAAVARWPMAASAGWGLAGLLGMGAWLGARRAFHAGPHAFFKMIFGGMLIRMLVLGLALGLVLGFDWLDTFGFVGGIGAGLVVFQAVEIMGLSQATKKQNEDGELKPEVEHAV